MKVAENVLVATAETAVGPGTKCDLSESIECVLMCWNRGCSENVPGTE